MENLQKEGVKPFDRLKMPPAVLYLFMFSLFAVFSFTYMTNEELDVEKLTRRNYLLAMKKLKTKVEYE